MIIGISTVEYNLHYDQWEYALSLLKQLVKDCLHDRDIDGRVGYNVYTYHGSDETYVDFYDVPDDPVLSEMIMQRSIDYSEEFKILSLGPQEDMGDLVLVDPDPDPDEGILIPRPEFESPAIINSFYLDPTDKNISDYLVSIMKSNIIYNEQDDTMYCYEEEVGWTRYTKDKLFTVISDNIDEIFFDRDDVLKILGGYHARVRIVSEMIAKIKSTHNVPCINEWTLIGCNNGVYLSDTGTFKDSSSHLCVTRSTHINYIPDEDEQDMILANILHTIFPNSIVFRNVMLWFGYLLVSGNPEKLMTIWHGSSGNNGKSWVQRLIRETLGDYYGTLPVSLLTGKRASSHNATPELAFLEHRLIVMMQEPDYTDRMNGGRVKEITGNDTIFIRELYKPPRAIHIRAKPVVVANNRIETVGMDSAIRRRFFVIPFESTFVSQRELDERMSKGLDTTHYYIRRDIDSLCPTLAPAFMRLIVQHHQHYLDHGWDIDEPFYRYTDEFIMSNNRILRFIHRYIVLQPGDRCSISTVYESFKIWYRDRYPSMRTPDTDTFIEELHNESLKIVEDRWIEDTVCIYSPTF